MKKKTKPACHLCFLPSGWPSLRFGLASPRSGPRLPRRVLGDSSGRRLGLLLAPAPPSAGIPRCRLSSAPWLRATSFLSSFLDPQLLPAPEIGVLGFSVPWASSPSPPFSKGMPSKCLLLNLFTHPSCTVCCQPSTAPLASPGLGVAVSKTKANSLLQETPGSPPSPHL